MEKEEILRYIAIERSRIRSSREFYYVCEDEEDRKITLENIKDSQRKIEYYKYLAKIDDEQEEDTWEPRD